MSAFEFFGFDPVNSDSSSSDFLSSSLPNLSPEEVPSTSEKSEPLNRQFHDKPYQNSPSKREEITSMILRKTANLKLEHQLEIDSLRLEYEQALAKLAPQLQYLRAERALLKQENAVLKQQLVELEQKVANTVSAVAELSVLRRIPTTYQVVRSHSPRFDRSMNAFQQFLLYVVIGMSVAGLSAIALSFTTLWPAVLAVIRPVVPFIFVAALIGLVAIFLWEFAQSQSHRR